MIAFEAPGKAVIWGEYAVLAGAPAMVMAVNRYARCTIDTAHNDTTHNDTAHNQSANYHAADNTKNGWQISAAGFTGQVTASRETLQSSDLPSDSVARPVAAAFRHLELRQIPAAARVELDTSAFYRSVGGGSGGQGRKLGIGSSAAICTATCAALAALTETQVSLPIALAAHRWMQGSQGSGVDVAAAYLGGILRFQDGSATPANWPEGWHYRFVWTGASASTASHVSRFNQWRSAGSTQPLDALCEASCGLFEELDENRTRDYVDCLKKLDAEANLGIYTRAHEALDGLANANQVVYKPCGAGGGDIGIALSRDTERLIRFENAAAAGGFEILSMEIAEHGIKPTR